MTITARYIDTCLSSYLQDGYNRPGQTLCVATLGMDLATTVEMLVHSIDGDGDVPEALSDGDLARALRSALVGVDLRYIDKDGNRQEERDSNKPYYWDNKDGDEPYVYVVLEWEVCQHDPVWASVAAADSCDGIVDISCRNCGASGSTIIEEKDINWE